MCNLWPAVPQGLIPATQVPTTSLLPSQVSPLRTLLPPPPRYIWFPGTGRWAGESAHIDTEECGHAVQVVGIPRHGQDLGDDCGMGPLLPELLHQLLQVAGGRLADGIDYRGVRGRGQASGGEGLMRVTATFTTAS